MCNFPDIQYGPNFKGLSNQKIQQGTYTYLKKNGIVDDHFIDGIPNMEKLEEYINKLIQAYNGNDDKTLYDIFCLIHIWGGDWGKVVFWNNLPFKEKWENGIKEQYRLLVKTCIGVTVTKDAPLNYLNKDINTILNAVQAISDNVCGLGVSFITKHTRFWLQKNNFDNPLPIFDSIMSTGLLNKHQNMLLLKQYWTCMIEKAMCIPEMTLLSLERQLFNYFSKNRPKGIITTKHDDSDDWNVYAPFYVLRSYRADFSFHAPGYCIPMDCEKYRIFVGKKNTGWYFCKIMKDWGKDVGDIENNNVMKTLINSNLSRGKRWINRGRNKVKKLYKYVKFDTLTEAEEFMEEVIDYVQSIKKMK